MTNKEIFIKALDKAKQNGYISPFLYKYYYDLCWIDDFSFEIVTNGEFVRYHINEVIFNHDFAKAFFGEEYMYAEYVDEWEYHLKEIILEKQPLKYIYKFI